MFLYAIVFILFIFSFLVIIILVSVMLFSCDEIIKLLIIWLLKLIIELWKLDMKTNCYSICENRPIWESGEFERIKNL
jgi:hypothetical protein